MNKCQQLLQSEIELFSLTESKYFAGNKPRLSEEMEQLKYNACSEAYDIGCISEGEMIAVFGEDTFKAVCIGKYEEYLDV